MFPTTAPWIHVFETILGMEVVDKTTVDPIRFFGYDVEVTFDLENENKEVE